MHQKKICMLGSFGVGKTSLVSQYVHSVFSETYHSTIGVKVDRKQVTIDGQPINLILWDLHGDDEFQKVRTSYFRGMSGYIVVVDGTRRESMTTARKLQELAQETVGVLPFLCLINKCDLRDQWALTGEDTKNLEEAGWTVRETSAKTGRHVDDSFTWLANRMLSS